ncbi:L,D-transpeptidase family protein [Novosphingobium sp. BL-52-GroH]|uniref:L,D-transpeptidase family protein n=1 Tax=Novosphingobium sp. BL-52-GroH TaxID=3349877 RepID=UPI00384C7D7F
MKIWSLPLFAVLLSAASPPPHWSNMQVSRLLTLMERSSDEGLAEATEDVPRLKQALALGDADTTDALATRMAEDLLGDYIGGCCNAALRSNWHIANGYEKFDQRGAIASAVRDDGLDALFARARPSHPFYSALRAAYRGETDPVRRNTLAANLDRWRWMPRDPGARYLLVNAAAFEATLWQGGAMIGRWAVVVGKTRSPTPVFSARVTGVVLNPWWEIPPAIARESIAGLLSRDPAEAARRGYVRAGQRYRQRPGANNALGRMKLVMPNPYNVYLHDTPAQSLFEQDVRAFSHGCVRVGDALGLAATLLGKPHSRSRLGTLVAQGQTQTLSLPAPIPVYVTYFTAEPDGAGGVRYFPDVYRRDVKAQAPSPEGTCPR